MNQAYNGHKEHYNDSPDTEAVTGTVLVHFKTNEFFAHICFCYIIQWMKLIMTSTMIILLILKLYLVCTCIFYVFVIYNKNKVERNNVEDDIHENEDDTFIEELKDLEDPDITGLYFILWSIIVSNLILN